MVYERFDVVQSEVVGEDESRTSFCCCIRLISVIVLECQSSLSTGTSVVGRGIGMTFR